MTDEPSGKTSSIETCIVMERIIFVENAIRRSIFCARFERVVAQEHPVVLDTLEGDDFFTAFESLKCLKFANVRGKK